MKSALAFANPLSRPCVLPFLFLSCFFCLQYYPPDFDPSKLPRAKKPKDMKVVGAMSERLFVFYVCQWMSPCSASSFRFFLHPPTCARLPSRSAHDASLHRQLQQVRRLDLQGQEIQLTHGGGARRQVSDDSRVAFLLQVHQLLGRVRLQNRPEE